MRIPDDEYADEPVSNLTPLIDVVFLLLVFFMLTTTFLDPEHELEIDLPEAQSGALVERAPEELIINVFADGRLSLSGRVLPAAELAEELDRVATLDPDTPVTIRGDQGTPHGAIVGVMDACGLAGLYKLSVGTLQQQ